MHSVLVVSSEPLGERMAGPAIRAHEIARMLGDTPGLEVSVADAGFEDYDALAGACAEHDVVVAQRLPPRLLLRLEKLGCRLVADLYNPTVMEILEAVGGRDERTARRQQAVVASQAVAMCAAADLVICASERQRDLWLGLMAGSGLIDLEAYGTDPSYRTWVDVVPFGLPSSPPQPAADPVLRAAFPAIGAEDRVLIWGGGIWNWLDAKTVIDAVGLLAKDGATPAVHLVFMGVGRPALHPSDADVMRATEEAIAHAEALGLLGERVHVNRDWVPYAERGAWLLEADLGVSAHHDHLETRFAFRTRMLDYVWAGLPVVATAGDTLGDRLAAAGAGRTVPAGDAPGFAAAIREQLDAGNARAALETLRSELHWESAIAPLVAFCLDDTRPSRVRRDVLRRATAAQYPRLLAGERDTDGTAAMVRKLTRNLTRAARRK